jgi:hypothetical protein
MVAPRAASDVPSVEERKLSAKDLFLMRLNRRALVTPMLAVGMAGLLSGCVAARAVASRTQLTVFEDDGHLLSNPAPVLAKMRLLGVDVVRLSVKWGSVAPASKSRHKPSNFRASDPGAYPPSRWFAYDRFVRAAQAAGISVQLDVTGGAPMWARGPGQPCCDHPNWEPSAREFGAFVHAVGERYSGSYDPRTNRLAPGDPDDLPAVTSWSSWNEPNYAPSLAPQGTPGNLSVDDSPRMYRSLLDATWSALQSTGHGHDTILYGELAPRGDNQLRMLWGGERPLAFVRSLYCVDSSWHLLRGAAARERGCPTTAAGFRQFPAAHPALFQATAFAQHPYSRWYQPNQELDPHTDFASLPLIGRLERTLNLAMHVYSVNRLIPVYDTEYGYITSPPKRHTSAQPFVSPSTAAWYLNWAEYLSWRDPRILTYDQYLLFDPVPAQAQNGYGGFASGLLTNSGHPKPAYYSFRLPLYLPLTTARRGASLEVWGCVRAAKYAIRDTGLAQTAQLQYQSNGTGPWVTVREITVTDPANCYFDVRVPFNSSGALRLVYTYPANDPLLPAKYTVYSRHVQVTVH